MAADAAATELRDGKRQDAPSAVVLTVPHGTCPDEGDVAGGHPCDWIAERSAQMIYQNLGSAAELFVAKDVPRRVCDLNRLWCRDHPWRERVREAVRASTFVLDVHSYPPGVGGWSDFEIVLLDDAQEPAFPLPYVADLSRYLAGKGVLVSIGRGGGNDIQDEMRAMGARSVLIEFNERLDGDLARWRNIARYTAEWLGAEPRR